MMHGFGGWLSRPNARLNVLKYTYARQEKEAKAGGFHHRKWAPGNCSGGRTLE